MPIARSVSMLGSVCFTARFTLNQGKNPTCNIQGIRRKVIDPSGAKADRKDNA